MSLRISSATPAASESVCSSMLTNFSNRSSFVFTALSTASKMIALLSYSGWPCTFCTVSREIISFEYNFQARGIGSEMASTSVPLCFWNTLTAEHVLGGGLQSLDWTTGLDYWTDLVNDY